LLQPASQATLTIAHALDGVSLIELPVGVGGDVSNTQVNPKKTVRVYRRVFVNVANLVQVELAVAVNQVALTVQAWQQPGSVCADDAGHLLPTVHCPDRDDTFVELVGDKPVIEGESGKRRERALSLPVQLVGVRHLCEYAHGDICAKFKL